MAYTVGTPSSNSQSGSATSIGTTGTISASSGDTIVVFVTAAQDQTASFAASDGTNAYALKHALYEPTTDKSLGVLVAENATAGTYTVTGSWSGTRTSNGVYAVPVSGLKPASYQIGAITQQPTPGTGTDGVTTGTMTPTEQPACVIGLVLNGGSLATPAAGTGFTNIGTGWDFGLGTSLLRAIHKQITSTSGVALTGTAPADVRHFSAAVILSESSAGAGGMSVGQMTTLMSPLIRM